MSFLKNGSSKLISHLGSYYNTFIRNGSLRPDSRFYDPLYGNRGLTHSLALTPFKADLKLKANKLRSAGVNEDLILDGLYGQLVLLDMQAENMIENGYYTDNRNLTLADAQGILGTRLGKSFKTIDQLLEDNGLGGKVTSLSIEEVRKSVAAASAASASIKKPEETEPVDQRSEKSVVQGRSFSARRRNGGSTGSTSLGGSGSFPSLLGG